MKTGIRITKAAAPVPVAGKWLWWADACGQRWGVWAATAAQAEEAVAARLGLHVPSQKAPKIIQWKIRNSP